MRPRSAIITLTLNPAVDVSSSVESVAPTQKLRCATPRFEPGGGGVNVARVCHRRGLTVTCVVTSGGTTGQRLHQLLDAEGLATVAVPVAEETRQSVAVYETSTGHEYRFVFPGPLLSSPELDRCIADVIALAPGASCLVVSGSPPGNGDGGLVRRLAASLPDTKIIVDTSGEALRDALDAGCYLAKPSARELAGLVGRKLTTEFDIAEAAETVMQASKVKHLVVSLGPGGAVALSDDGGRWRLRAPAVDVQSATGAGDSMVAGFAIGIHQGLSFPDTLRLGVAFGTAAVLTSGSRLCESDDVDRLLPMVTTD